MRFNMSLLVICVFFRMSFVLAMTPEKIFIYAGTGADSESVLGIEKTLKHYVKTPVRIQIVPSFLSLLQWLASEKSPSLLIMPGGNSSHYEQSFARLPAESQERLIQKIYSGSLSYLGICAGVFFAAKSYRGHFQSPIDNKYYDYCSIDIARKRLSIFGHLVSPDHKNEAWNRGRAVALESDNFRGEALWIGGPTLSSSLDVEILAFYNENCAISKAPAIFARSFSSSDSELRSHAVASAVHFELTLPEDNNMECMNTHKTIAEIIFNKLGFDC